MNLFCLSAQMLVLMDTIWQEKSLDLSLIPYGCISTGHNVGKRTSTRPFSELEALWLLQRRPGVSVFHISSSGMIEIVRNAVTIAAIQRNVGGTMGAFKNDALSEWLRSKSPLTEIVSMKWMTATY